MVTKSLPVGIPSTGWLHLSLWLCQLTGIPVRALGRLLRQPAAAHSLPAEGVVYRAGRPDAVMPALAQRLVDTFSNTNAVSRSSSGSGQPHPAAPIFDSS